MATGSDTLVFRQRVAGSPEDVFYAFSTAQGWRDWLCDTAHFRRRSSRSYQLGWEGGWYAGGSIESVDKPEQVVLTWQGRDDPARSKVTISLAAADGGTEVEIRHEQVGEGEAWEAARAQITEGWQAGLENLESICKSGVDLRVARQPMLGIMLNDFDERIASEIGVPVTEGVRIAEAIEGMGAERAGIQPNDVVVNMGGVSVHGFPDLGAVLREHRAGDVIPVTLYRGAEQITVDMELSARPLAEVPMEPDKLAQQIGELYAEINAELRTLFDGVSEGEAEHKPGPNDWSAKQTLAHMVDSEGYNLIWLNEVLSDGEREFAEGGENDPARLDAMLHVTPTVAELLDRLERTQREVLYLLEHARKLKTRKGVLWRGGQGWLQYPGAHERQHMQQIEAAIESARVKEGAPASD